jgi:hypothetical protein
MIILTAKNPRFLVWLVTGLVMVTQSRAQTPEPGAARPLVRSVLVTPSPARGFSQIGMGPPASSHATTNNIHEWQRAWKYNQRAYPRHGIPRGARVRALQQINPLQPAPTANVRTKPQPSTPQPLTAGGGPQWVSLGPAPIRESQIEPTQPCAGRVQCIAVDPGNSAHWLIGAAQGGVWASSDSGVTWAPMTDGQASLAMGALAFAPSNPQIVYAGTGEPDFGSQDDYYGAGLLKSSDGGKTWQLLAGATFAGDSFAALLVSPVNPSLLLASLTGGQAGRGDDPAPAPPPAGVFLSSDGGNNWVNQLPGYSTDLKADPSNFNHQLTTLSADGMTGFDLYQSTDAGANWAVVNGPWAATGGAGRMQLAISPSSPNTAYVSLCDVSNPQNNTNYNSLLGIWRTDNAWAASPTWTRLPQPQGVGDQLWYDQVLSVDPANPSILYFGETPLWKYNGTSWTTLGAVFQSDGNYNLFHCDHHAMAWAGNRLIFGNDGGVWSTADGGATFYNHNTNNLAITQFYYGSVHPQTRNFALGGAQDNGSEQWQGSNAWPQAGPGDGADNAISPVNPDNNWLVSWDKLVLKRVTGGGQFSDVVFVGAAVNLPNLPFIGRVAMAPADENVVLTGNSSLIKTTSFFTAPAAPDNPTNYFFDSADLGSPITAIAFAPSDVSGNTYAFGTADGQLWLTSTGTGNQAQDMNTGGVVPGRYVTAFAFQPNNANILYVTLSGFDEGTPGQSGHVFKTSNALSATPTWVNVSPPVDLPHNAIVIDPANPNNVYVGTDIGVWTSGDAGATWSFMGGPAFGLPNVAVFDVKIQAGTGRVFAFTHGRGAFMYDPKAVSQPPVIASFTPSSGSAGNLVTLLGAEFNNATAVLFGGVNAASFTVNSSTQIVATVSVGALSGPLTVTTPGGTAASANSFTVNNTPAITSFTPTRGNAGAQVTIMGANLNGATNVTFGGISASFTVDSSTQVTATVPTGAATGKIIVNTPNGTAQSEGVFTVTTVPAISGFSPAGGGIGSSVTITGANFVSVTGVAFNGVSAVNPTVNSSTLITASVPAGATTGPISVTTANGTAQSAAAFMVVPAPAITAFTPASGSAGTLVTVNGNNFSGVTAVTFNGQSATSFSAGSASQLAATAPAGVTTGPIAVTTPGGTALSAVSFVATAAPANDNFAFAQVISGSAGTVTGNNVAATKEPGEPNHAGNEGGKSIWYRWTAPGPGTWTFNTAGSTFVTLLAIYTGSSVGNLTPVASDISVPGTNFSSVTFTATAGTVYQIAVDGFLGDTGEGAPAATAASGAVVLNWNLSADLVPQIASFSPASGPVDTSVRIAGVNFQGATGVTFNGVSAAFTVGSDQQITATVPSGASTGPIRVVKSGGTAVSATAFTVPPGPPNDNFANAQVITGSAGTLTGSNVGASKEPGEPNHAGNPGGASVWYSWTAPSSGAWRFDTFGSSFDTLLAVYTGTSVGALSLVVSNDNFNGGDTSEVIFRAAGGTIYHIAVDGYNGAVGSLVLNWAATADLPVITGFTPASGGAGTSVTINGTGFTGANIVLFDGVSTVFAANSDAQISANVPPGAGTGPISVTTPSGTSQSTNNFVVTVNPPANDNFANALAITGTVATVTGSNVGATREPGEPFIAGNSGGASVWWTWTAPSNGTYSITTRDSSFPTLLGVYTGGSVASLNLVVANDEGPNMGTASLVTFTASAGVTYQIDVDGFDGATGDIVLTVYPAIVEQVIYYTGFESSEGYSTRSTLAGQNGWQSHGPGFNGVVYDYFYDFSQQAYIGFESTVAGADTYVWQPLNYTPDTNSRPVVIFGAYMEIVDSTDYLYDDFGWSVFDQSGNLLFFLDFDNYDLGIYSLPNDGSGYQYTGQDFQNGYIYYLEIDMDFGRNSWNAFLDETPIVQNQPLSATNNVTLDLGDIDATWLQTSGTAGNNYMLFDDYYVAAAPSQAPRIITPPQPQTVPVGATATFLVVADSPLELAYQWQFNGTNISGATDPTLTLANLAFSQAGNYSVVVSNAVGVVTSTLAALTVAQLPNLTPYQPAGWSDKIVAATNATSTLDAGVIFNNEDIYVSWAVVNNSSNGNVTVRFYTELFLDGVLSQTWYSDGLEAGYYVFVTDFDIGQLAPGTHTLAITTDATGVVAESDKSDNSYTKTITVISTNQPPQNQPPQLASPALSAKGVFQFTLRGIPSRQYQIQVSTDLANWSALTTLTDTNANGVLLYSDPSAANLERRFYRVLLLSP